MKNILKGLSIEKRREVARLTEQIFNIGFADGQAATSTVEDTAVESPQFKSKKRRAKVGDRILITSVRFGNDPNLIGGVYTVIRTSSSGSVDTKEMGYRVGTWDFVDTEYEVIVEKPEIVEQEAPLTANQQREELNQKAKRFVEQTIYERRELVGLSGKEISWDYRFWDLDFVVNPEKRRVVVLLKDRHTKRVRFRGIAKCMPGDVFNADIGKAIALAKALEIDIPQEFIDAVQPTELVVGMGVFYGGRKQTVDLHEKWLPVSVSKEFAMTALSCNIIDDTNAQYGESDAS